MKKVKLMKHRMKDRSQVIGICLAFALFLLGGLLEGQAQSIRRQSIGISGANMVSDGLLVKQTIGQPYATATYYENGIGFRPGFQQPAASASRSMIAQELLQSSVALSIYPNPAASSVRIENIEGVTNGLLKIMDSKGRLMVSKQLSEGESHSINCENWSNGLYLISVSSEGNASYSSKLIISK